jgi:hypothetical protein
MNGTATPQDELLDAARAALALLNDPDATEWDAVRVEAQLERAISRIDAQGV